MTPAQTWIPDQVRDDEGGYRGAREWDSEVKTVAKDNATGKNRAK
jgi:hypothetical protein